MLDARAATGEALWWITAAGEFLRSRVSYEVTNEQFYAVLGGNRLGRVLGGLRFVRNRAGHQLAHVLCYDAATASVPYRIVTEGTAVEHRTRVTLVGTPDPRDRLSKSDVLTFAPMDMLPEGKTRHQADWYEEAVARRPVGVILDEIVSALARTMEVTTERDNYTLTLRANLTSDDGTIASLDGKG